MSMTLISTATVGAGGAASIDFTSIPGTYTDLLIVLSSRSTVNTGVVRIAFNGSTTSFTSRALQGTGSSSLSFTETNFVGHTSNSDYTANSFGSHQIYIANYAGNTNKTFSSDSVAENNASANLSNLIAGLWSNTAAITQVTLSLSNFAQYSTASLYGITKGSGGATVS